MKERREMVEKEGKVHFVRPRGISLICTSGVC